MTETIPNEPLSKSETISRSAKVATIIFLIILSLGTIPFSLWQPLSDHECFVSITAREMLQSNNWVIPTCNGQLRLEKTPLLYWLVASVAKVTGTVNEFSARMPDIVFGLLSVMAILYFVNVLFSFRIAAISAGVWATSLSYIRFAASARPEISLTFFVMLCFLSFYAAINAVNRNRQIAYMLVFWISLSLGMLAKGPAPLPYVILPLFCYVAVFKKWSQVPRLLPIIGSLIFIAIVLPWPLFIAQKMNWDLSIWKREFVDRLFGDYRPGHKPNYYYLYIMLQFMLPWAAFVPMALFAPFYKVWEKKRPFISFMWICFVADLLFISIDGGKRQHYILPIMPAMAILSGILLDDMVFVRKAFNKKFVTEVFKYHLIIISLLIIGGSIYAARIYENMLSGIIIAGIVAIICMAFICALFIKNKPVLACAMIFASIVVIVDVSYIEIFNPNDRQIQCRDFSRKIAGIVPQDDNLVGYNEVSTCFIHYFGRPVPQITDQSALLENYEKGNWIVAIGQYLQELEKSQKFKQVYYQPKAQRSGHEDEPGALFHKVTEPNVP